MYTLDFKILFLIVALGLLVSFVRSMFRFDIKGYSIRRVDILFFGALTFRFVLLLFIVLQDSKGTNFLVYDDEIYYKYAMEIYNASDIYEVNGYHIFLRYAYLLFGKSSITGRLINIVFASVSVYPLSYLETSICDGERLTATKLLAFSPFMMSVSLFEIKDILMLLLLVLGYALIFKFSSEKKFKTLLFIVIISVLSESVRTGAGFILVGLCLTKILSDANKMSARIRFFFRLFCVAFIVVGCVIMFGSELGGKYYLKFSNYQKWIFTQFSSSSIYNWFVITKISDIWKVPFSCFLYILQPLNALDGSGRVFAEYGLFLRVVEIPVLLSALLFIYRFIQKEKLNSILLIIPYLMLSCINLTNAREAIYLYPLLYLAFSYEMFSFGSKDGDSVIAHIMRLKSNRWILYGCVLLVWSAFVITRILEV